LRFIWLVLAVAVVQAHVKRPLPPDLAALEEAEVVLSIAASMHHTFHRLRQYQSALAVLEVRLRLPTTLWE
jgi:hypothetical protein